MLTIVLSARSKSHLCLFVFHLAPDSAILERFAYEKKIPTVWLYSFKIICYMVIRRWKDIFFLSVLLLNVHWIIWLHLHSGILLPFYYPSANSYLRYAILALVLSASRYFVLFFNRSGYTSTGGSPSSIRRSSPRDLVGFSAAIRRRFEKKQTAEGGSTFAMYRLGIMAVGAFRALFQPLEGSSFVSPRAEERYSPPFYPIPIPSSSSTWRRICELNSNGSPPFRSFQRVPMFSLRLMYSRKARPSFASLRPLGICFSFFLFRCGDSSRA